MPYSNELYRKAERLLEKRRDNAVMLADAQKERIRAEIPEIDDIQKQLSNIGMEISKLYFFNGDVKEKVDELRERSEALIKKRGEILVKNGYKETALSPEFVCPVCEDRGFIGGRLCSCHRQILKDLMRKEVSAWAPLERCTFEAFSLDFYSTKPLENSVVPRERAENILNASMKYAQNFSKNSKNLIFLGGTGLGKTHLSLAIANVVINRGYSVCYGTSQNICEELIAQSFGRDGEYYYTKARVLESDLLIIDDLGTEVDGKYNISEIYNVINSRILSSRPTIISTNLDWDELEYKYDQRITSRLTGEYTRMKFFGTDIRNQ